MLIMSLTQLVKNLPVYIAKNAKADDKTSFINRLAKNLSLSVNIDKDI